MRQLPLVLSLSLIAVRGVETAPTFFVSSSRGSDAASGLSPSAPWRSLAHAMSAAGPSLQFGGSLLLRRGDTWVISSPLALSGLGNGSSTTRTLIGAYVDSACPPQRPLICAASERQIGPLLHLHDSARFDVVGLEFSGGEGSIALTFGSAHDGIFVHAIDASIIDSVLRNAHSAAASDAWGGGVLLAAAHANVTVTGLELAHVIVDSCDTAYIQSVPASFGLWTIAHVVELTVRHSFFVRNSFNTLALMWISNASVYENVFLRNAPPAGAAVPRGTTDIILGAVNASVRVFGNEVGWRGEGEGAPDGCALDFEVASDGVVLVDNFFHHSWGGAVLVFGHGTTSTHLHIVNNTFVLNGANQTSWDRGTIALTHPNSTGELRGNRVLSPRGVPWITPRWPTSAKGWNVSDNTVDGENATLTVLNPPIVTQLTVAPLLISATAPCEATGACVLRYTTDASRPLVTSATWPACGVITLPARTTAVLVKAFPVAHGEEGGSEALSVMVESPSSGDVFLPLAATAGA